MPLYGIRCAHKILKLAETQDGHSAGALPSSQERVVKRLTQQIAQWPSAEWRKRKYWIREAQKDIKTWIYCVAVEIKLSLRFVFFWILQIPHQPRSQCQDLSTQGRCVPLYGIRCAHKILKLAETQDGHSAGALPESSSQERVAQETHTTDSTMAVCWMSEGSGTILDPWSPEGHQLLFPSIFVGTSDTCFRNKFVGTKTCLSAYNHVPTPTDKFLNVPTNFQMYDKSPKRHYWGGGGGYCSPWKQFPPPPLATLMDDETVKIYI